MGMKRGVRKRWWRVRGRLLKPFTPDSQLYRVILHGNLFCLLWRIRIHSTNPLFETLDLVNTFAPWIKLKLTWLVKCAII